ncbi:MAG: nucleotidyltransferase domain-containing protein [Nanoarchaeota archaeon]|nr:nucleotidyltransferase domain-containing protein [Nanoarchaeota archaeon]MBU4299712.1 nucleotidyltransferase domain-containing protein [Nanoarchaeota archaeon]MBU4451447.1 nucleotidyltransferase domain-containing protein [Nanoarchaeota archaeon]MCG2723785.1 nucleotidyltransferase domain-containing protein [archaeon]
MKENLVISYAADFVSFVLSRPKTFKKIDEIVLFGSVARKEAGENSDVDIFINTPEEKTVELEIEIAKKEFYESVKFKKYWKLLGVENDIRCVVGKLEEWNDLKGSILSDGIVLYGKYKESAEPAKLFAIFDWRAIKPETKRALFNKRMFGYKQKGKSYAGMLQKSGGQKLDNSVLVPVENSKDMLKLFRDMNISVKIRNVNEY